MQTDRPTHPSRWRLKKAAPNPEAAKTHSLRVRPTKAQARHLFGPSREEASGFTIATPGHAALMASAELLHHILFQFWLQRSYGSVHRYARAVALL
jgi:hypothetical protein